MIGVYDSGSGGLTVLRALRRALPQVDFVYFGDHAFAPYGEKDLGNLYDRGCHSVDFLFRQGCSLVVVACNTSAATVLRPIQQNWLAERHPDKRVLGVFVPLIEQITGVAWSQKKPRPAPRKTVAVFATARTVSCNALGEEVFRRARGVHLVPQSCPALAAAIEDDACPDVLDSLVATYVRRLQQQCRDNLDEVVLGCTHYPLVSEMFRRHLTANTVVLSQPDIVAHSLENYIRRNTTLGLVSEGKGELTCFTSGDPRRAHRAARRFLGQELSFEQAA